MQWSHGFIYEFCGSIWLNIFSKSFLVFDLCASNMFHSFEILRTRVLDNIGCGENRKLYNDTVQYPWHRTIIPNQAYTSHEDIMLVLKQTH